jgi:hypothetical protein
MFTMANWELTAAVLSEEGQKSFQQHFKDYGLHEPVLLYRYNSTSAISNRRDTATAIADGADAVTSVVSSLQKRIEKQEHDAIARNADTKNRLDSLASNLHDLTTFTSTLANRQEEMGRGLFILHQQTALDMGSSRIENRIALARNTFRFPLDNDEKEAARIEIVELEAKRSQIAGKLDALRASTNGSLIAVPGPAIAPPPASDTSPRPTKRLRSSLDGATVVDGGTNAQAPGPDMQDQHMGEVRIPLCSVSSRLMAAHDDNQGHLMMHKPRMTHHYTIGPDGTRGFSRKRRLIGPLGVVTSRRSRFTDAPNLVVQSSRPNVLFFLAIIFLFASLVNTAAAASAPFTIYALNSNGLVHSAKLSYINTAIKFRSPQAFVLNETKTNTKTGPNLPNDEYAIFEEPGVQATGHHIYKWGVVLGIR